MHGGQPVKSLGEHEHCDKDLTMCYSRNLDPKYGKGIEFVCVPMGIASKEVIRPETDEFV